MISEDPAKETRPCPALNYKINSTLGESLDSNFKDFKLIEIENIVEVRHDEM